MTALTMLEKRPKKSKHGKYQQSVVLGSLVKKLKKITGLRYTKTEIRKVWKDYVENVLIPELVDGKQVKLNKRNKLEVVGERVLKGTRSYDLLAKGKYVTRNGYMKSADNMNIRRRGIKYGVKLFTDYEKTFYFKAHPKISSAIHKTLNETMINYRLVK